MEILDVCLVKDDPQADTDMWVGYLLYTGNKSQLYPGLG
jgi:hypothetical protein